MWLQRDQRWFMLGHRRISLQTVRGCSSGQQKPLHVPVAIWMKIFRHCTPGALLFLSPSFPTRSLSPLFFYLISLANGNFLGRTEVEGIVVVTRRNGKTPVSGRLFSSFLSFFTACCPPVSVWRKREMKEKESGESVNPASLLVSGFSQGRQGLSGALLCEV